MKRFLFIRGEPGAGKITTARILEKDLGWKLFWLHDLDPICKIVGSHKIPRLMDHISNAVLFHMFQEGKDVIFVRPARDTQSVGLITGLADHMDYQVTVAYLTASFETLCERVKGRKWSEFRIGSEEGLREYLTARPHGKMEGETIIKTDDKTPEQVAEVIKGLL